MPDGTVRAIPYNSSSTMAAALETDIYIFGGYNSGPSTGVKTAYKYDTLTNTYTQLADIPINYHDGGIALVNTDIYLIGSATGDTDNGNYKYDTLTNTYTKMTDVPIRLTYGKAIAINTDIYLFHSTYTYKYDTLTDTYTKLTDIPNSFLYGYIALVGTDIYLLGGGNSYNTNYKYNVLTDTYTKMTDIPYQFTNGRAVSIGTDIYLFGSGNSNYNRYNYKYSTLTDTYTQLTDIPYGVYSCGIDIMNNNIYLFGGGVNPTKVQVLQFPSSDFDDNSVVLLNGSTYETQLFTNPLVDDSVKYQFADVWFYTDNDGLITDIPTYYGDGTQWINIKNPPPEPTPYTELEYIQGTGTQYIDSGVAGNTIGKITTKFKINTTVSYSFAMGASDSTTGFRSNNIGIGLTTNESQNGFWYNGNSQSYTFSTDTIYDISMAVQNGSQTFIVNGTTYNQSITSESAITNKNLYLFAMGYANTVKNAEISKISLYETKIYATDQTTLIRDFIPVKDENNVVCLYDKVTEDYFYNSGTGTFTAGPEVQNQGGAE